MVYEHSTSTRSRRRKCGAKTRSKTRGVGGGTLPADTTELEIAVLRALEGYPSGRTRLALARELGVTVRHVTEAVGRLTAIGAADVGTCDAPAHRSAAGVLAARCRVHGGASTGAKTAAGRARLVDAGRRGGLARWRRVRESERATNDGRADGSGE